MKFFKDIATFILFMVCLLPVVIAATTNSHYKFHRLKFYVNPDSTFEYEEEFKVQLQSDTAIKRWREFPLDYYPKSSQLNVLCAYVIDSHGKKYLLTKEDMVLSSRGNSEDQKLNTLTLYLPHLDKGSQFYLKYHRHHEQASIFGFNRVIYADYSMLTKTHHIQFNFPKQLKLKWHADKPYQIESHLQGDRQIVTAIATNLKPIYNEPYMISPLDIQPAVTVSKFKDYPALGDAYWRLIADKVVVNDEIKALAKAIVGKKTGRDAIVALNEWVSGAIKYHSLSFDFKSHYVPNSSIVTLHRRYGDCKDKVILLKALTQALGINSYPVLVDWSNAYRIYHLPQPSQFNHLMIYFPEYKLYSNPTDENSVPGILDIQLTNKMVLLINSHSKIAYTPKGQASDNRYQLNNHVVYTDKGGLSGYSTAELRGGFYLDMLDIMGNHANDEDFARTYLSYTPEGGRGRVDVIPESESTKRFLLKSKWQSDRVFTIDDVVILPIPQGIDVRNPQLWRDYVIEDHIEYPMLFRAQTNHWQYTIDVPKGYRVMHLPKNIAYHNQEGDYISSYHLHNNKIVVKRRLIIHHDLHKPNQYHDFKHLIRLSIQDFRNAVVLVKA